MKRVVGIVALVLCATVSFAGELAPYTFGMKVVAPALQAPLMYIPAIAGATGDLLTITTGATSVFTVAATGVVTAKGFSGPATGITAVPAASVSSGTLSSDVKVSALTSRTEAQILATTPTAVGLMYFCNDCTVTPVVVSTGASDCMDWSGVGSLQIPN